MGTEGWVGQAGGRMGGVGGERCERCSRIEAQDSDGDGASAWFRAEGIGVECGLAA